MERSGVAGELRQVDGMVTELLERVSTVEHERELADRRSSSMISLYNGALDLLEQAQVLVEQTDGDEPAVERLTQLIRTMEERRLDAVEARRPGYTEQQQQHEQATAQIADMEGTVHTLRGQLSEVESEAAQLDRDLREARQTEPLLRQEYEEAAQEAASRYAQVQRELAQAREVAAAQLRTEMSSFALNSEEERRKLEEQSVMEQEALKAEVAAVKVALEIAARAALQDESLSAGHDDLAGDETSLTRLATPVGQHKASEWTSTPLSASTVPEPELEPEPEQAQEHLDGAASFSEGETNIAHGSSPIVSPASPKILTLVPARQSEPFSSSSVVSQQHDASKCSPSVLLQMAVALRRWHQGLEIVRMHEHRLRRKKRWALRRWRRKVSQVREALRARALDYAKQTRKMLNDRTQAQKQMQQKRLQREKQPHRLRRSGTPQQRPVTPKRRPNFQEQSATSSWSSRAETAVDTPIGRHRTSARAGGHTPEQEGLDSIHLNSPETPRGPTRSRSPPAGSVQTSPRGSSTAKSPVVSPTRARPYPHEFRAPEKPPSPHRDQSRGEAEAQVDAWISPRTEHQSPEVLAGHSAGPLRERHGALTPLELKVAREMQQRPADRQWLPPSAVVIPAPLARPARPKTPSKRPAVVAMRRKRVKSPRRLDVLDTEIHSVLTRVMGRLWDYLVDTPSALAPLRSIAEVLLLVRQRHVNSTYRDMLAEQTVDMGGHLAGLPPARHQMQAQQLRPVLRSLLRQAGIKVSQSEFSEVMSKLDSAGTGAVDLEHLLAVAYTGRLEIVRQKMLGTSKARDGRDWLRALKMKAAADEKLSQCADPLISREVLFSVAKDLAKIQPSGESSTFVTTSELDDVCDFLSDVWLEDSSSRASTRAQGRYWGLSATKVEQFFTDSSGAVRVSDGTCRLWMKEQLSAISDRMHELRSSQDQAEYQFNIRGDGCLDLVDFQTVANHLKIGCGYGRLAMIFMLLDTSGTGSLRVGADVIHRVWAHRHGVLASASGTSPRYPTGSSYDLDGKAAQHVADEFSTSPPLRSSSSTQRSLSVLPVTAFPQAFETPPKRGSVHGSTNYYDILGVGPDSTPKQIRRAYLAKVSASPAGHLERSDFGTGASLTELAEAYEVLRDSQSRTQYDIAADVSKGSPSGTINATQASDGVAMSSLHPPNEVDTHLRGYYGTTSPSRTMSIVHQAVDPDPDPEPEPEPEPAMTVNFKHARDGLTTQSSMLHQGADVELASGRSILEGPRSRQLGIDVIGQWVEAATVVQAHWRGVCARRAFIHDCIAAVELLSELNSRAASNVDTSSNHWTHSDSIGEVHTKTKKDVNHGPSEEAKLETELAEKRENFAVQLVRTTVAAKKQESPVSSIAGGGKRHQHEYETVAHAKHDDHRSSSEGTASDLTESSEDFESDILSTASQLGPANQRKVAMVMKFTQLRDTLIADSASPIGLLHLEAPHAESKAETDAEAEAASEPRSARLNNEHQHDDSVVQSDLNESSEDIEESSDDFESDFDDDDMLFSTGATASWNGRNAFVPSPHTSREPQKLAASSSQIDPDRDVDDSELDKECRSLGMPLEQLEAAVSTLREEHGVDVVRLAEQLNQSPAVTEASIRDFLREAKSGEELARALAPLSRRVWNMPEGQWTSGTVADANDRDR